MQKSKREVTKVVSNNLSYIYLVSILYKSIAGRYRPVRVADGPITARYRFIRNANLVVPVSSWFIQQVRVIIIAIAPITQVTHVRSMRKETKIVCNKEIQLK